MEETPREGADKEEMEIPIPSYPLPLEIQQMDHSEKACRYCGVSYLILHEFQRLQERLQEVERELERERGSMERERAVRDELQQTFGHLEEMKATMLQQEETTRALDLQLCVVRHEMESVRTDKERVCTELENEHARRLHLRWRCEQQQKVLGEALALLKSSRGEMTSIKSLFTHLLEKWEDSKALIQQSCISADAENVRLQQAASGMEAELKRLRGEMPNLRTCLDAAQEQILQLEGQVQTQKLLQNQKQVAQSLIQGLREEVKTLKEELQNNMLERENMKKLLETKSAEKDELQELWSQQARDQKANMERLSRDLREKEESWLSCQQRCESLQKQLLAWQQKEEEVTRRLERAEAELKDLRAGRSALQLEREELRRIHADEIQRLEESFRSRLKDAEEHSSKMKACLEAEQMEQLKRLEMELRRDAEIELDIHRQKTHELLQKYQTENQRLQKKIPAMVHSATQELHEEIAVLQERIKQREEETQQARESVSQRMQQVLQELKAGEDQLQVSLQDLQQTQKNLQQLTEEKAALEEEKYLLEETVRRECAEREELTAALTLAREQLLDIKHLTTKPHDTPTHARLSRLTDAQTDSIHTPIVLHYNPCKNISPPTQGTRRKGSDKRHSGSVRRSVASWHESSGLISTLPKINKDRIPLVNDSYKHITTLLARNNKL